MTAQGAAPLVALWHDIVNAVGLNAAVAILILCAVVPYALLIRAGNQKAARKRQLAAAFAARAADEAEAEREAAAARAKTEAAAQRAEQKQRKADAKARKQRAAAERKRRLVCSATGHSDVVRAAAFSRDGRLLATAGGDNDRSVRVWYCRALFGGGGGGGGKARPEAGKAPKYHRVAVELDHASAVGLSENGRRLVFATAGGRDVLVYALAKGGFNAAARPERHAAFPSRQKSEVAAVRFVSAGASAFVVTGGSGQDTEVRFFSPAGAPLQTLNTNTTVHYGLAVSADNRLVGVASFAAEATVLEVVYGKGGAFEKARRAMVLRGHSGSVRGVAFQGAGAAAGGGGGGGGPPTRAATVGKDGRWALHDVAVRYDLNEDPKTLNLSDVDRALGAGGEGGPLDHVALSPDGRVVAVARAAGVAFYDADTGRRIGDAIADAHEDRVAWLEFSADGRVLGTLGTASKHCRLWRVPQAGE